MLELAPLTMSHHSSLAVIFAAGKFFCGDLLMYDLNLIMPRIIRFPAGGVMVWETWRPVANMCFAGQWYQLEFFLPGGVM